MQLNVFIKIKNAIHFIESKLEINNKTFNLCQINVYNLSNIFLKWIFYLYHRLV
jgi:hypothetical protein